MGEGRSDLILPFAVFIVVILLISAVFMVGIPASSEWTASNTSPGNVVVATATWTTTNDYGVTVTYTGLSTSTASTTSNCVWPWCQATTTASSSSTTSTTSTAGTPWIRLTFHGTYQITDANGNVIYTNTFEWAPVGGSGEGTHIKYDVTYTVEGQGVDWTTLTVNVNVKGLTAQPSVADPNTPEILNTVDSVDSIAAAKTTSGHLGKILPIATLLGTKTPDKTRVLTPSISIIGTANAKLLPGYSLAGGNNIDVTTGPVVGVGSEQWNEPTPATPPTPTPPTPTPPTPVYTGNVVDRTSPAEKQPVDYQKLYKQGRLTRVGALLGVNEVVQVFGAETETLVNDIILLGLIAALVIVSAVVIIIVWKKH